MVGLGQLFISISYNFVLNIEYLREKEIINKMFALKMNCSKKSISQVNVWYDAEY